MHAQTFKCISLLTMCVLLLSVLPDRRRWKRTFEVGEDKNGVPTDFISGEGSNHKSTKCGEGFIETVGYDYPSEDRAKRGSRSHESGVGSLSSRPCSAEGDFTLRHYPTWNGHFRLPVLVMFWMYVDAADWRSMTGERFSQLTTKSRFPENGQILTTHVWEDGTLDIGHSTMSFRSQEVKVPLRKWNLQSLYIENLGGKTHATLWSDDELAAVGTCKSTWDNPAELRHWHMGLYGENNSVRDNNYPNVPFKLFNDDLRVIEVGSRDEAFGLVEAELNRSARDSIPPVRPKQVDVVVEN